MGLNRLLKALGSQAETAAVVKLIEAAKNDKRPARELSVDMLIALCKTYRGEYLAVRLMKDYGRSRIPGMYPYYVQRRNRNIVKEHLERGLTPGDLASRYHLSPHTVRKLIEDHRRAQRAKEKPSRLPMGIHPLTGPEATQDE